MKKKHLRRKLTQEQVDSINRKFDLLEGTELDFEIPKERTIIGPDGRGMTVKSWQPEYPKPDHANVVEQQTHDAQTVAPSGIEGATPSVGTKLAT